MATLHDTTELTKKFGLWVGLGIGSIFVLLFLIRVGIGIKNFFVPKGPPPPTVEYGKLPETSFPPNVTSEKLTYTVDTISGFLPDFPNQAPVYRIVKRDPGLLDLQRARQKASSIGFSGQEQKTGEVTFVWNDGSVLNRTLTMNITTSNFNLSSQYTTYPPIAEGQNTPDENGALETAKAFLGSMGLLPADIDISKTKPKLYTLKNGVLIEASSLSTTQIVRVDLFQKDINDLPMFYPHPPHSTMSFLVSGSSNITPVVQADFFHQAIEEKGSTYPLKTTNQAFEDLRNGKGYIAAFYDTDTTVTIRDVQLGYYFSDKDQDYLTPIIVFHGDNDFYAYVPAVQDSWIK